MMIDLVHVLLGGKQITVRVGLEGRGKHVCANGDCEYVPGSYLYIYLYQNYIYQK